MNDELNKAALADIDRVLSYQPGYGGTGAVTEIATSFKACILRWAPPGSSHRKMAEAIDPFPTARAGRVEQHVRALMATFRRDVEAGLVALVAETQERDMAKDARRLLAYLHAGYMKHGSLLFVVGPNEETTRETGLTGEAYEMAAKRLVTKGLGEWMGTGHHLHMTSSGLRASEDEDALDYELFLFTSRCLRWHECHWRHRRAEP